MNKLLFKIIFPAVVLIIPAVHLNAADPGQLHQAFNHIYNSKLETDIYTLGNLTVEYRDMRLTFDTGQFVFFTPVVIDTIEHYYGGFFVGPVRISFRPGLDLERDQLRRFFESDAIDAVYENVTLLFGDILYRQIIEHLSPVPDTLKHKYIKMAREEFEYFTKNENMYYAFRTLQSLFYPEGDKYLAANFSGGGSGRIFYVFNPFDREEIRLLKHYWYWHDGGEFMETVCSYSQYADDTHADINGIDKPFVKINHYDIKGMIGRKEVLTAKTKITFEMLIPSTQMLEMSLHPELIVDSIMDESGEPVNFMRYEKNSNKSRPLYIIMNHPAQFGDTLALEFFYSGKVSKKYAGQFYMTPGSNWYPGSYSADRALFDMEFHTPKNYRFIATGNLVESRMESDTLITRWKITRPTRNVSFSMGLMNKYDFKEKDLPLLSIYFDKELHKDIARNLSPVIKTAGTDIQEEVAEDVINSLRLFSDYFGAYSFGQMRISETMAMHGEAFPGFLHLGVPAWIQRDDKGYISASRAHEVAHQWWGVGVEYETYHDQWLSEGFAEYCGLMYVQAAFGNEHFEELLSDYRDNIFSNRKYLFSSGEQSGPIAMGYRTLSTITPGDYGLIIYEKAAFCLHMLRNLMIDLKTMREDAFFNMMREFYLTYRGKAVSTADFKKLTEKYLGIDMSWFYDQWIYGNSLPEYNFTYGFERDAEGRYTGICRVITKGVNENFRMYVPLEIEVDRDRKVYIRIMIEGTDFRFTLPGLSKIPRSLRLNPFMSVLAKVKQ